MTEKKERHFIQKYPIIPVLFIFLFAWGWLVLITTFKPSQKNHTNFEFEYFDKKTKQHFYIKNDSLTLNRNEFYKILKSHQENTSKIITAQNNEKDSIQVLIYNQKAFILK